MHWYLHEPFQLTDLARNFWICELIWSVKNLTKAKTNANQRKEQDGYGQGENEL